MLRLALSGLLATWLVSLVRLMPHRPAVVRATRRAG
jgi:hypothetical protein